MENPRNLRQSFTNTCYSLAVPLLTETCRSAVCQVQQRTRTMQTNALQQRVATGVLPHRPKVLREVEAKFVDELIRHAEVLSEEPANLGRPLVLSPLLAIARHQAARAKAFHALAQNDRSSFHGRRFTRRSVTARASSASTIRCAIVTAPGPLERF